MYEKFTITNNEETQKHISNVLSAIKSQIEIRDSLPDREDQDKELQETYDFFEGFLPRQIKVELTEKQIDDILDGIVHKMVEEGKHMFLWRETDFSLKEHLPQIMDDRPDNVNDIYECAAESCGLHIPTDHLSDGELQSDNLVLIRLNELQEIRDWLIWKRDEV